MTGEQLDYFVSGYGTGGTHDWHVARVLRAERPDTKIITTEPDGAALLSDGRTQERREDGSASGSHPAWAPHMIQGWTPDFIPLVAQEAIDKGYIDEWSRCRRRPPSPLRKRWRKRKASFAGSPAVPRLPRHLDVAQRAAPGSVILCTLPDTGERYLSTPLFRGHRGRNDRRRVVAGTLHTQRGVSGIRREA